jgi:hypothetical protein
MKKHFLEVSSAKAIMRTGVLAYICIRSFHFFLSDLVSKGYYEMMEKGVAKMDSKFKIWESSDCR